MIKKFKYREADPNEPRPAGAEVEQPQTDYESGGFRVSAKPTTPEPEDNESIEPESKLDIPEKYKRSPEFYRFVNQLVEYKIEQMNLLDETKVRKALHKDRIIKDNGAELQQLIEQIDKELGFK